MKGLSPATHKKIMNDYKHHAPGTDSERNQLAALHNLIEAIKLAERHGLSIRIDYRRGRGPYDWPDKVVVEAVTWWFPEGFPDERHPKRPSIRESSDWDISDLCKIADVYVPERCQFCISLAPHCTCPDCKCR